MLVNSRIAGAFFTYLWLFGPLVLCDPINKIIDISNVYNGGQFPIAPENSNVVKAGGIHYSDFIQMNGLSMIDSSGKNFYIRGAWYRLLLGSLLRLFRYELLVLYESRSKRGRRW